MPIAKNKLVLCLREALLGGVALTLTMPVLADTATDATTTPADQTPAKPAPATDSTLPVAFMRRLLRHGAGAGGRPYA